MDRGRIELPDAIPSVMKTEDVIFASVFVGAAFGIAALSLAYYLWVKTWPKL